MSSSTAAVEAPKPERPKRTPKRIGGARKLDKRVEPKPDGRYLIYYKPS